MLPTQIPNQLDPRTSQIFRKACATHTKNANYNQKKMALAQNQQVMLARPAPPQQSAPRRKKKKTVKGPRPPQVAPPTNQAKKA